MNPLSAFGLGMRGVNEARMNDEQLAEAQRRGALENQKIELGNMGLEEARHEQAVRSATRTAAANAANAGRTISGSLLDMSDAAGKLGDVATAQRYRDAHRTLEEMGAKEVVHAALVNPTPGERPDIVQILRQNERTKDARSATLDDRGNLTVVSGSGPSTVNVGTLAVTLGMVKPWEKEIPKGGMYVRGMPWSNQPAAVISNPEPSTVHTVGEGQIGVVTGPGINPTLPGNQIRGPAKTFSPDQNTSVLDVYDDSGQKVGQRVVASQPGQSSVGAVTTTGGGLGPTGRTAAKALPELKEAASEVLKIPGMATKSDPNNPLDTHMVLTPEGAALMPKVEALIMANRKLPAHTAILVAMRGTPVRDGEGRVSVQFGGQLYPLAVTGQPPAPARAAPTTNDRPRILNEELQSQRVALQEAQKNGDNDAAARAQSNIDALLKELGGAKQIPVPAQEPPKAAPKEQPKRPTPENPERVKEFNQTVAGADQRRTTVREARRQEVAQQFKQRLERFNREDQIWLTENASLFNREQLKQYHDRKAKAATGFRKGGKVGLECRN